MYLPQIKFRLVRDEQILRGVSVALPDICIDDGWSPDLVGLFVPMRLSVLVSSAEEVAYNDCELVCSILLGNILGAELLRHLEIFPVHPGVACFGREYAYMIAKHVLRHVPGRKVFITPTSVLGCQQSIASESNTGG